MKVNSKREKIPMPTKSKYENDCIGCQKKVLKMTSILFLLLRYKKEMFQKDRIQTLFLSKSGINLEKAATKGISDLLSKIDKPGLIIIKTPRNPKKLLSMF